VARHNKHLARAKHLRKGMTPPMEKTSVLAAMLAHAFGDECWLTKPYMCHG
jgi:threonine aldolase